MFQVWWGNSSPQLSLGRVPHSVRQNKPCAPIHPFLQVALLLACHVSDAAGDGGNPRKPCSVAGESGGRAYESQGEENLELLEFSVGGGEFT